MENNSPVEHFDWNLFVLGPTFVVIALVGFIVYVVITYRANQRRHREEKQRLSEQFSAEIDKAKLEMHELTLDRIASEIHDNIGHNLTIAGMNLALLKLDDENELAQDTKKLVHTALKDLRNLSRSLSKGYMMDLGLEGALRQEIEMFKRTSGLNVRIESHQIENNSKEQLKIREQTELIFFRCAQEALSNIAKYAGATEVVIDLWFCGDACVKMDIVDNGIGIDLNSVSKGIGLRSMEQRMILLNGKLEIHSAHQGTHLRFVIGA